MATNTTLPEGSLMKKEIRTEIEIKVAPDVVWQQLTDFASFPQWNPFIRRASGELLIGAQLEVFLRPPGARGLAFRPTVLAAEPDRELHWRGQPWLPGLFAVEHIFTIKPLGENRVLFV